MEVWKDIKGYESLYQVSNLGNVRSLNWHNERIVKNLYLKHHNRGYLQVELSNGKTKKMFMVHRLVALHFVKGYQVGLVVNHLNENKIDNRAENLEWCTHKKNFQYSLQLHPERAKKYIAGIPRTQDKPIAQLKCCGEVVKIWDSVLAIKIATGYHPWSITECCRGKRKTAYGYLWRYAI